MKLLAELSWAEVGEYLEKEDRIIISLGAIEEHGPHLGLGTDFIEAEAIAKRVSEATGIIAAPTLNYGMSMPQMGFPGTLSLSPKTYLTVLEDIFRAVYHHGFRRILFVNGHGGNTGSIKAAVQSIAHELEGIRFKLFEWWTDEEAYKVVTETMGEQEGSHASLGETAFMMAIRPSAVKLERLTGSNAPVRPSWELTTIHNFRSLYPDGIMGLDPKNATAEAGKALLEKSVEICVRELTSGSPQTHSCS